MDDGADVVGILHSKMTNLLEHVIGGTEETTTGIIRLRSMAADGCFAISHHRCERCEYETHV